MNVPNVTLPPRPITVHPPGMGAGAAFWGFVGSLFLFGIAVFLILAPLPALLTDYAVKDKAVPVPNADIKGSCDERLLVLCDATLSMNVPGKGRVERSLHYFFVDVHFGTWTATVMADPARPEDMTTDLALDRLLNRTLTMIIAGTLFLAIGVTAMIAWVKNTRFHAVVRKALSGQELRPILVRLDGVGPKRWVTSHRRPDGTTWTHRWPVPRKLRPIPLDPPNKGILAITAGDGTYAMPLDVKLSWLKMTKEEKQVLRSQLGMPPA